MQNNEPLPTLACGKEDKTLILLKNGCYKKKTIHLFLLLKNFLSFSYLLKLGYFINKSACN